MKEHPFCLSGMKNKNVLVKLRVLPPSLAITATSQITTTSKCAAVSPPLESQAHAAAPDPLHLHVGTEPNSVPLAIQNIHHSLFLHFIKYISDVAASLFILLAAQSGVGIGDLDGELSSSLHDDLTVLRRHVVRDLRTVGPVGHRLCLRLGSALARHSGAGRNHPPSIPSARPNLFWPEAGARLQNSSTLPPAFL